MFNFWRNEYYALGSFYHHFGIQRLNMNKKRILTRVKTKHNNKTVFGEQDIIKMIEMFSLIIISSLQ